MKRKLSAWSGRCVAASNRSLNQGIAQRKTVEAALKESRQHYQALLGINVRLLTLKMAAKGNTANLKNEIANTQRLVQKSVQSINQFASELDTHEQA